MLNHFKQIKSQSMDLTIDFDINGDRLLEADKHILFYTISFNYIAQ